ncbi:MAG: leucine--tRNA ligase, partial [Candidatus Micrarchaeota archaeon]
MARDSMLNLSAMEKKWQQRWEDTRAFEANPAKTNDGKFYLTAAFPYPNSPQHIGHARTYTTTDVYARFMRMKGRNVLFPMAFHVTGTPILAMAKRIAARDPEILEIFDKIYGIPVETTTSLTDPKALVTYFSREIEAGMREMGFSIDWRRKFYTYDLAFNRFIEWQFSKLNEKGYITQGAHPVPWCPKCNNAVGAHDTQEDMDPEIGEYVLLKFKFRDGFLLTATFRPETIYGVTNVWVNPDVEYAAARSPKNSEIYYVSLDAVEKLNMQGFDLEILDKIPGKDLLGENATCENLMTSANIPLLPASFVDPKNGSGVVMSVPAHAPYDYLALRDLGSSLAPIQVLKIDGYGSFPAKEIVDKMGLKDQNDPLAEDATKEIYSKEAHTGVMIAGKYAGARVGEAKERIEEDMLAEKKALSMHEIINGPIFCRCGSLVSVKTVQNQWFINYGDEGWKKITRECLREMHIIPEKTIPEYDYTIDWLKEKACVRASGLGTRFLFDRTQMIESLSDSTIYMAFYTVAPYMVRLLENDINNALFDYVFLGKPYTGKADKELLQRMRDEFLYWYPLDSRHSGADLVHNHLTFFIFNHVAVFPRELWPRQIVTNGFVLMEGKKMSKSMGNILPLRRAIRKYGADVVRFSVVSGADLAADSDFNQTMADGVISRLNFMFSLCEQIPSFEERVPKPIDKWLLSRFHRRVKNYDSQLSNLELRDVTQEIFYNTINDLKWYLKRTPPRADAIREVLEIWTLLVCPFMPHFAEEMWEKLWEKRFVKDNRI